MKSTTSIGRFIERRPALLVLLIITAVTIVIAGNLVWLSTTTLVAIFGLIALSVGIAYGQCGILSVAQGTFAAVGGYTSAMLSTQFNWSPFVCLPLAIVVPALLAYPLAFLVVRLSPLALAIATLIFGKIIDVAIRAGGDVTGGYIGLSGIPPLEFFGEPLGFHVVSWAFVIVVVWFYSNLLRSSYGRAINTIRHDALRAAADGINVRQVQSAIFSLAAGVAGAAGWLYAHYVSFLSPDSLGMSVSISALLMAVIGGSRRVLGPLVGAAILITVVKFIPGAERQGMFYGAALIIMLVFAPDGLLDLIKWPRRAKGSAARKQLAKATAQ